MGHSIKRGPKPKGAKCLDTKQTGKPSLRGKSPEKPAVTTRKGQQKSRPRATEKPKNQKKRTSS